MKARVFIVLATLVLCVGAMAAAASQDVRAVQGELLSVDPEMQILAIETTDGEEWQFRYDEQTEVTGAEGGIAGLADMSGPVVTVHFTQEELEHRAIRIEIHDES